MYYIYSMKAAILATLMCLSAVSLFCQPKGSPTKDEKTATQATPTPTPPDSDRKVATEAESTKRSSPHWYTSSEWWLVLIAALTGAAIGYQAREMARTTTVMEGQLKEMRETGKLMDTQLKTMQRQVNLQELGMQQWLELSGWRIQRKDPSQGKPSSFEIATEIINVTALPLTLKAVNATIAGREFSFLADNMLPPNGGLITAEFPIPLKPEETARFATYALNMPVSGSVTYLDYFGKTQSQPFCFSITCGPDGYFRLSALQENDGK
jgi:hypothetical protein